MAAFAPSRYFTYKNQVPLSGGQKLGFTRGRGYYARQAPQHRDLPPLPQFPGGIYGTPAPPIETVQPPASLPSLPPGPVPVVEDRYGGGSTISFPSFSPGPVDSSLGIPSGGETGGGGGGGGGSFSFDTDPLVLRAKALEQMGLSQLDAWERAARERAVIQFGDPNIASLAGFGLDPQAGTFARQNYLSGNATMSRLDKLHELQRKAVVNRLAGRNILFSGDLGYLQGEAAQEHGNRVYDARQQLLDYFADLGRRGMEQRQAIRSGTLSAYEAAYARALQYPELYAGMFGTPASTSGNAPRPAAPIAAPSAPGSFDSIYNPRRTRGVIGTPAAF